MDWFKNVKLQTKFFVAFGVLLSFVVIIAALAIITIVNVETAFKRLTEGPASRLMYASDAVAELANCRRYVLVIGYVPSDIEYTQESYENCKESLDSILYCLDEYYDNFMEDEFLSDEEKSSRAAIISGVKDLFISAYLPNVNALFAAALANDTELVNKLAAEGAPIGEEITNMLLMFRSMVQSHVDDITTQTQAAARESIQLLIILSLFLIIISMFIFAIVAGALRSPIAKMEAAMSEIARGNLSYPIRTGNRDELGILSNHIGDMVDTISMLNKAVAIVDNVDELIFVTDLEYNLIYVNKKAVELYGLNRDDCLGKKCYKTLYGADAKRCGFCPLPSLLPDKHNFPSRDWELNTKVNGKDTWFACKTSIIRWVDGSLVQIYTFKDDTLNKYHEEQQKRYARELRESALAAEEASRAKSTFLANMSHEIRTPMNAVMGMSELILRKELPQDVYENALGIRSASQNLLSIINDLLDFSKIESGMLEIIDAEYEFSSLMNDIIGIIRIRLIEKPIEFIVDIDPSIPMKLRGDEVRIRQVLINLLGNAVKYTNEGYIALTVRGTASGRDVTLIIDIEDSGLGIKDEDIDKLFNDFVQIDTEKNRGIEGTGLGLAITRSLCQAMDGDICVKSEYGKGSTFTVTLPQKFDTYEPFAAVILPLEKSVLLYETRPRYCESIAHALDGLGVRYRIAENISELYENLEKYPFVFVPSFMYGSISPVLSKLNNPPKTVVISEVTDSAAPRTARVLTLPAHSLPIANALNDVYEESGMDVTGVGFIAPEAKVLVVDDITANLKVAEGLMSPYEMQVQLCSSGNEALALIADTRYDLVFMDHMMPGMDGIETTRRIRKMDGDYFKTLPIIALTANAVSGVREMFVQNGLNDFLAKPIETSKLNMVLERWIPKNKRASVKQSSPQNTVSDFVNMLRSVPMLSVDEALSVMGDSSQKYEQILKLSVRLLPENITLLNNLLDSDLANYAIEVHGVKGILYTIGAYTLGDNAYKLEKLANRGDIAACRLLHPSLMRELTRFFDVMTDLFDRAEVETKQPGDIYVLRNKLPELDKAIDFYDAALALDILAPLCKCTYDGETDKILSELSSAFEHFDFERAAELRNELESS